MATPGLASLNAAPAAIEMGSTVDEPDTTISPARSEAGGSVGVVAPTAVAVVAAVRPRTTPATARRRLRVFTLSNSLFVTCADRDRPRSE